MHLQAGRRPGFCRVAVLALQAKKASVDVRLVVAIHALSRCDAKELVVVAILAGDFGMGAFQGEDAGMIEIGHAVGAIMAVQAFRAKLRQVFLQEFCQLAAAGMAGDAGLQVEQLDTACMAGDADQRLSIISYRVPGKAEAAGSGVLEGEPFPTGRHPGECRMAVSAIRGEHLPVRSWLSVAVGTSHRLVLRIGAD